MTFERLCMEWRNPTHQMFIIRKLDPAISLYLDHLTLTPPQSNPISTATLLSNSLHRNTPIIMIGLEYTLTEASLIDSGAQRSIIEKTVFGLLSQAWTSDMWTFRNQPHYKNLFSATGHEIATHGCYSLLIHIGDTTVLHDFIIVPRSQETQSLFCEADIILGMDFMNRHHAILDAKQQLFTVGHDTIHLCAPDQANPTSLPTVTPPPDPGPCSIDDPDYLSLIEDFCEITVTLSTKSKIPAGQEGVIHILPLSNRKLKRLQETFAYAGRINTPADSPPLMLTIPSQPLEEILTIACRGQMWNPLEPLQLRIHNSSNASWDHGKRYQLRLAIQLLGRSLPDEPRNPDSDCIRQISASDYDTEWNKIAEEIVAQTDDIGSDGRDRLRRLLHRYKDVFKLKTDSPGLIRNHPVEIELTSKEPICLSQYPLYGNDEEEAHKQVQAMLATGVLEESRSPWNFPILFVKKKIITKEGNEVPERRMCVDLRELNTRSAKINFPIPTVDSTIQRLQGSQYFSCFDVLSGFWHLPLTEASRQYVAFSTRRGHFQFKVLPFGWVNAPFYFQRYMQTQIANKCYAFCQAYIDDLVIHSEDLDGHFYHLEEVLKVIQAEGLKLKLSKCAFFAKRMEYLGHIISKEGIKKDPKKLAVIRRLQPPRTRKQLRTYLGKINYYAKFIEGLSSVARPLTQLTSPKKDFKWLPEHTVAFERLKEMILSDVLLAFPDEKLPFNITTDASAYAIGAVLSQTDAVSCKERPIWFLSKTLDVAQQRYTITERELFAIVYALDRFRPYIYGRNFYIHTDHRALLWFCGKRNVTGRLARWSYYISQYARSIHFVQGKNNYVADALSRAPYQQPPLEDVVTDEVGGNECLDENIKSQIYNMAGIRMVITRSHKERQELREAELEEMAEQAQAYMVGCTDPDSPAMDPAQIPLTPILLPDLWKREPCEENPALITRNAAGYWVASHKTSAWRDEILWVPPMFRADVLRAYHHNPTSAHPSSAKMYQNVIRDLWWKGIAKDISEFVSACPRCQRNRLGNTDRPPIQARTLATLPMQRVSMDTLSLKSTYAAGANLLLIILDEFTRYALAIPIRNELAQTIADVFFYEFVLRFGIPEELLTDRGSNFLSEFFLRLIEQLEIVKVSTMAYRPQGNGANERVHSTLYTILRNLSADHGKDWKQKLPLAMYVYNTTVHKALGMSPHEVLFSYPIRHISYAYYTPEMANTLDERVERMLKMREWVSAQSQSVEDKRNAYCNRNRFFRTYQPGDLVKYKNHRAGKLGPKWSGPVTVLRQVGSVAYIVALDDNNRTHPLIHSIYLRPWVSGADPNQLAVGSGNYKDITDLGSDDDDDLTPP